MEGVEHAAYVLHVCVLQAAETRLARAVDLRGDGCGSTHGRGCDGDGCGGGGCGGGGCGGGRRAGGAVRLAEWRAHL